MTLPPPQPGQILWTDLTVPNAEQVRDFYQAVVVWTPSEFDGDFNMMAPGNDKPVAGVCHARGINADLPPQWLIYIVGGEYRQAAKACTAKS